MAQENTLRILVATDNHLGVWERDAVRRDDSFDTFEEIFRYAHELEVDMILLGGDLFHDNKPSQWTMYRSFEMFRKYCMGNRPCNLELLSEPEKVFPGRFNTVNYEDPNYNISMPVFIIHGNHDDPTGEDQLCALDLMAVNGLVNYFGKCLQPEKVIVNPVLLKKGTTKLALYGVGNIRDERLYRTFRSENVHWLRPELEPEDYFNLLVIHQNRLERGPKNFIPEDFLPSMLDFIVWGHEHDCIIDPWENSGKGFHVVQPGSSVVCSLSEGESIKKHVALMEVTGKNFTWKKLALKTCRPFVIKDMDMDEEIPASHRSATAPSSGGESPLSRYLAKVVDSMIVKAKSEWEITQGYDQISRNSALRKPTPLPLIRLRLAYSPETMQLLNTSQFGIRFKDKVANPREILHFMKKRVKRLASNNPDEKSANTLHISDQSLAKTGNVAVSDNHLQMDDIILEQLMQKKLNLFVEKDITMAVSSYVDKDNKDSIISFVDKSLQSVQQLLEHKSLAELNVPEIQKLVNESKQLRCAMLDAMNDDNEEEKGFSLKDNEEKRFRVNEEEKGFSLNDNEEEKGFRVNDNEENYLHPNVPINRPSLNDENVSGKRMLSGKLKSTRTKPTQKGDIDFMDLTKENDDNVNNDYKFKPLLSSCSRSRSGGESESESESVIDDFDFFENPTKSKSNASIKVKKPDDTTNDPVTLPKIPRNPSIKSASNTDSNAKKKSSSTRVTSAATGTKLKSRKQLKLNFSTQASNSQQNSQLQ